MRIRVLAVGQKMPSWVETGYHEYSKRLPNDFQLELVELPPGYRGKGADIARAMRSEGDAMLAAIGKNERVVALDVKGQPWTTEQLAKHAENWRMDGGNICLLVGGPDGLDKRCLEKADQKWSLSALTLPHPLVRIVLAEQMYRAWTLLQGHPYHK